MKLLIVNSIGRQLIKKARSGEAETGKLTNYISDEEIFMTQSILLN